VAISTLKPTFFFFFDKYSNPLFKKQIKQTRQLYEISMQIGSEIQNRSTIHIYKKTKTLPNPNFSILSLRNCTSPSTNFVIFPRAYLQNHTLSNFYPNNPTQTHLSLSSKEFCLKIFVLLSLSLSFTTHPLNFINQPQHFTYATKKKK
jgi:hypothetical protein